MPLRRCGLCPTNSGEPAGALDRGVIKSKLYFRKITWGAAQKVKLGTRRSEKMKRTAAAGDSVRANQKGGQRWQLQGGGRDVLYNTPP